MVTHDPRAAAIADRILFLADGLVVKDIVGATASEVIAAMEELTRRDESRPQRSLGRKLRTFLTGFAIVLGVATITGTYVLTDSISKAFDSIFTTIYQGTDAVISGKTAFDVSEESGVEIPSFDESLLAESARCPRSRPRWAASAEKRR